MPSGRDPRKGRPTCVIGVDSLPCCIAAQRNRATPFLAIESTIVANSSYADCVGTFGITSDGHNLADDHTCNLAARGDQPNTEPLLRPLDNYGGPTRTFALRRSSPAVDAGFADGATTDQRGRARPVNYPRVPKAVGGDNSDIGAFELQAP